MNIFSISLDRNIAEPATDAARRQVSYARDANVTIVIIGIGERRTVELAPNVRVHAVGGSAKFDAFFSAWRQIRTLLNRQTFDVVTAQDPLWTGILGWLASRRTRGRFHLQDHSAFFGRRLFRFRDRCLMAVALFLARRADRIRTVSLRGRAGLLRIGIHPGRVDVIPIAADLQRFATLPSPASGFLHVACVARLEWEKGVDVLLQAWPIVIAATPSALLRIIGDGSQRAALEAMALRLGVADSVSFLGRREDVAEHIAWSTLVVQPSRFEGWGLSVVEAAAAGRPIVMTDVGCAGEVIRHGASGLVVPVEQPLSLADAILHMLKNPDQAAVFGVAARAAVCALPDPGETARRIRASFGRCLSRKPSVLVTTQTVDMDDPDLGFFHRWLELLAERVDRLTVICLREGRHALPLHVEVRSLGKERRVSRLTYVFRFFRSILSRRRDYTGVFIHMNPIYVVLGGPIWKLTGKRMLLWYVHKSVEWKLRFAERWVDGIFSASAESFRLPSYKLRLVGHGIDTERFSPRSASSSEKFQTLRLLSVGRVSPSKDQRTLIEAVAALLDLGIPATLDIVGGPSQDADDRYLKELHRLVAEKRLESSVRFLGPKRSDELPDLYRSYSVFVHASRTGSIDKVVLEALACGLPVYSSSEAFASGFSGAVRAFSPQDARGLAERIAIDVRADRMGYNAGAADVIRGQYDLRALIGKIADYFV